MWLARPKKTNHLLTDRQTDKSSLVVLVFLKTCWVAALPKYVMMPKSCKYQKWNIVRVRFSELIEEITSFFQVFVFFVWSHFKFKSIICTNQLILASTFKVDIQVLLLLFFFCGKLLFFILWSGSSSLTPSQWAARTVLTLSSSQPHCVVLLRLLSGSLDS